MGGTFSNIFFFAAAFGGITCFAEVLAGAEDNRYIVIMNRCWGLGEMPKRLSLFGFGGGTD